MEKSLALYQSVRIRHLYDLSIPMIALSQSRIKQKPHW
jgi:hypothetical protein